MTLSGHRLHTPAMVHAARFYHHHSRRVSLPAFGAKADIAIQGWRNYGSRTLVVHRHLHNAAGDHKSVRGSSVYLKLLEGKDVETYRQVARKACVYALLLSLFFLIFGTLILHLFGVPLAMVRIVGGIILMKIRFELFFSPSKSGGEIIPAGGGGEQNANIAFVPLAMPLMCGPGAIATILGMASTIRQSPTELASLSPSWQPSWPQCS